MNSKKNSDKPTTDTPPAVTEAEAVLARADQYVTALRDTHSAIPAALAQEQKLSGEWGSLTITGGDVGPLHTRLSAVRERREADVRRRSAAAGGLLGLETELAQARAGVDQERSQLAATLVNEFGSRWNRACHELAALHAEAQQLSTALHARVDCPPPYSITMNVASSQPEVRLSVPLEPPPVTLPPALATVAGALDRLDGVLAMIGGVRQAREFDSRLYQLSVMRGQSTELHGVFRVIAEFTCPMDGLPFQPGTLIDHSLIGHGHLQRLQVGRRFVQPVELEVAAA